MYLKLNKGNKEKDLRKINKLILKIFEYAARSVQFGRQEFEQFVEHDEVWLAKRYNPSEKFYDRIKKLFDFSCDERREIYEALQHDMEFDLNFEETGFVFMENALSDGQKKAAKELILHLYDELFRKDKFIIQGETAGYQQFKDSLFERNKTNVCPACLTMQTNLQKYGEVDHYFPKKSYPALIFHPGNLSVICRECNDLKVKGEKDPLKTGHLTEVYIPYLREAEKEVELAVREVEEEGKDQTRKKVKRLVMIPRAPGADDLTEKRIHNLEYLFDLRNRWSDRMESIIEYELQYLEEQKEEDSVKRLLHEDAVRQKRKAEKNPTKLLEAATASYLEKEGRKAFLAEWRMRQRENEKTKK